MAHSLHRSDETQPRGASMPGNDTQVLVAGATGYLGRFVAHAYAQRGYRVRVLARDIERLGAPGPFGAPAIRAPLSSAHPYS